MPEEEARAVRDHLAECRSCLAAYVDAVRYRAAWLADSRAFRLDDRDLAAVQPRLPRGRPEEKLRGRPAYRRLALVASVATLLAVSILILAGPESPTLGFHLDPATLEATNHSTAGGLVLPGAAANADGSRPERRSGAASSSLELDAELKAAIDAYEGGSRGPDAGSRVVAALLADGDIAAANDYAQEALRAHPDDVPLLVFAAAARIGANDLAGAERLLRRAIRRAPRDPVVALDLGLVLCRLDRGTESRGWLERAAASRVAPLAARARRELGNCGATNARD